MIKCLECKNQPTTQLGKPPGYCGHTHYSVSSLESVEDIKSIFPDGRADDLNWIVASTSGVHGTYATLAEVERTLCTATKDRVKDEYYPDSLTVLIILPRMVRLIYGEITVKSLGELDWLRNLISSSVATIARTQKKNMFNADLFDVLSKAFEEASNL